MNNMANERESGVELLRIVAMLGIIAHHMVVNSGIPGVLLRRGAEPSALWLQCWGMWGKTAIDIFILITGYFMCTSQLTIRRFLKLFLQIEFYTVVIWVLFWLAGYEKASASNVFLVLTWPFSLGNRFFTEAFVWFYLFIPFYNVLLKALSRRGLFLLLGLAVAMFTVSGTFFFNKYVYHDTLWYAVVYLLGAALRLHPFEWMASRKKCLLMLAVSVTVALASVLLLQMTRIHAMGTRLRPYFFVSPPDKLLALATGTLAFLTFSNIPLGRRRWINRVASVSFGVFLIHTSNNSMRQWLWRELLDIPHLPSMPFWAVVIRSAAFTVCIYAVCGLLDAVRIALLERPLFRWYDRHFDPQLPLMKEIQT